MLIVVVPFGGYDDGDDGEECTLVGGACAWHGYVLRVFLAVLL